MDNIAAKICDLSPLMKSENNKTKHAGKQVVFIATLDVI